MFEWGDEQVHPAYAGNEGRPKLQSAHATVVGLGAVGGVAAERLALGGVGWLTLVDRDVVEGRNLERPSLYGEADLGNPKAVAAQARLRALNRKVRIEARAIDVHAGTAHGLVGNTDVIVDGTDNLTTRYVLNEASIERGIPFLYGGAMGATGMASPLCPPQTPCFRCLLPPPANLNRVEPCQTGIASVAPRVADLLASQALQFLVTGTTSPGLYVVRDGAPSFERLEVYPRPGCPACRRRAREFLIVREEPTVVQLCGDDTVSLDPGRKERIPLERLAARLAPVASVRLTPYLVSLEVPPYSLSIFPDGRAIIRGARSPEVARVLYDRYVGV